MSGQAVVTIGSKQWTVSLAATLQELAQGLGGLSAIPAGTGMLFDLGAEQVVTVTTVPMLFPLDVVFINSSLIVVDMALSIAPGKLVTSEAAARYFLEINAGEAADIEIETPVYVQQLASSLQEQMGGIVSVLTQLVSLGFAFGALGMMTRGMLRSARGEKLLPLTKREGGCEHHPNCSTCPHLEQCNLEPTTFGNPGTKARLVPPPARELLLEPPPRRRRGLPLGRKLELITPEEEQRIHELRALGLTLNEIAERMNRAISTVWRTIHRGHPPLHQAITHKRIQEVLRLRRAGLTLEEIGKLIGVTKQQARFILHRGGERMDIAEAIESLREALLGVSGALKPPATLFKLTAGANRLQDIGDEAVLLLEIMPETAPIEYHFDVGWAHTRALLAEEVLRTGAWCLQEKPKAEKLALAERLGVCAEAAMENARGIIENWPGYETRATVVKWETEEMMKEETSPTGSEIPVAQEA